MIVVDNDDGPRGKGGVFGAVKQVSGLENVDGTERFYHVCRNLYLIPTPLLPGGGHSMIESFLQPSVRETRLNGKVLNLDEKTFDKTKHISKELFVRHVVRKNTPLIDFSGYKPILDTILEVIEDYDRRKP